MRILHVYAGPFPSHQGTQVYLAGLLGAQAALGHDVHVRCWAGGAGAVPAGVQVRRLARGSSLRSGPSLARAPLAWALHRALRCDLREPFDVLHLHHVEAPLLGRGARGPVRVHHLHTALSEELPTYSPRSGRSALAGLGVVADRALVRCADATLALSPHGARLARRWGARRAGWVAPGVEEVPLIDPERARAALGLCGGRWMVYTGNLDGYQRIDRLLALAARTGHPLVVVTGSPIGPLRREAARCGVRPERLRAIQTRDHAVVQQAIAAGTVGVIPRTQCAGFPMKALNFLAQGRPVIVDSAAMTEHPGVVRVDRPGLDAAVCDLLRSPERARALGAAGRREVRARGTWAHRAQQIDDFYASVAG